MIDLDEIDTVGWKRTRSVSLASI